jgi:dethiobiotin synthetase
VVIIARNRLGTINHTMLTVRELQHIGQQELAIVLMSESEPDISARTNVQTLSELAIPIPVFSLPFLQNKALKIGGLKKSAKKVKKTLAQILA